LQSVCLSICLSVHVALLTQGHMSFRVGSHCGICESVKDVIYGLGRVNFKYLLLLRTVKFYIRLYFKSGLLHNVFWSFMIFNRDECMKTVFIPLHKAISNLLCHFYDYVFGNV